MNAQLDSIVNQSRNYSADFRLGREKGLCHIPVKLEEVEKQIYPQEPFQFPAQGHSHWTPNYRILREQQG